MNYQIVIPARGGSKRLPGKNLKILGQYPLIAHTILFALESFSKENIWVNTDDLEIAKVAEFFGAQVTFRPIELGLDAVSTVDVLNYQLDLFQKNKINCDAIILLQATNPFRPKRLIENSIIFFEKENRGSLASFSRLNRKYGRIINSNFIPMNYFPGQRMQDIEPDYFENGLIYITRSECILNKLVITNDVYPMIVDGLESLVDIDDSNDLIFAEFVYNKLIKQK